MADRSSWNTVRHYLRVVVSLLVSTATAVAAQTVSTLQGSVFDISGAAIPDASIAVLNAATNFKTVVVKVLF